ncbi:NfeD family protein [Chloroflexota bacterium]
MFQINPNWLRVDPWLIVTIIISIIAFVAISIYWGIKAHRRQVSAGREELIGKSAEVDIALDPKGVVLIQGERWTAVSDQGPVKPGEEVIITRVDGLKLRVVKKE